MKRLLILLLIVVATMFAISSCEHVHYFDGEWEILKPATCTENGEKVRYCYCGERQTEVIYALGHTEVIDAAVDATCTSAGKTEGKHCSVCGEVLVAQGYDIALGHNYKYKIEFNIFTGNFDFVGKCDQPGCLTPELREENIDVIMEEVLPTCTTDGYLTVKYEKDGVLYEMTMRNGNRTGHNYVESNKVEPTMYSDGSVTLTCSNEGCGKSGTLTIPMMVFNENTEVLSDATEQSPVVMRYTYVNREFDYELVIDFPMGEALSHNYKFDIVYNEATDAYDFVGVCNQPGCLTPELREENVDVTIEEHNADCTTDGYIYVIYMKDGIVYSLTIPTNTKAGHNYDVDNPVSLTKPTWDNDGSVTVECTNEGCGHTVTVVLPKCENGVTVFENELGTVYYLYTDEETRYEIFFIIRM